MLSQKSFIPRKKKTRLSVRQVHVSYFWSLHLPKYLIYYIQDGSSSPLSSCEFCALSLRLCFVHSFNICCVLLCVSQSAKPCLKALTIYWKKQARKGTEPEVSVIIEICTQYYGSKEEIKSNWARDSVIGESPPRVGPKVTLNERQLKMFSTKI